MSPDDIKRLRLGLGMRQDELGKLVHAHSTTVSRWETSGSTTKPDPWQRDILASVSREPADARKAIDFLAAGQIGAALGALLRSASTDKPPAVVRAPHTGPRVRRRS